MPRRLCINHCIRRASRADCTSSSRCASCAGSTHRAHRASRTDRTSSSRCTSCAGRTRGPCRALGTGQAGHTHRTYGTGQAPGAPGTWRTGDAADAADAAAITGASAIIGASAGVRFITVISHWGISSLYHSSAARGPRGIGRGVSPETPAPTSLYAPRFPPAPVI